MFIGEATEIIFTYGSYCFEWRQLLPISGYTLQTKFISFTASDSDLFFDIKLAEGDKEEEEKPPVLEQSIYINIATLPLVVKAGEEQEKSPLILQEKERAKTDITTTVKVTRTEEKDAKSHSDYDAHDPKVFTNFLREQHQATRTRKRRSEPCCCSSNKKKHNAERISTIETLWTNRKGIDSTSDSEREKQGVQNNPYIEKPH